MTGITRRRREQTSRLDVLLVCTSGGHLLQLHALRAAWEGFSAAWVTNDRSDARSLLRGETVFFGHWPTTRSLVNLARNFLLAWRLVRDLRPAALFTTGAALAVPFAWIAWLHRVPVVYVESVTRVDSPSLSCRLSAPATERIYVQWPQLEDRFDKARYVGSVFSGA